MNIHEYQGKEILKKYNIPVPEGKIAFSSEEAIQIARKLGGNFWVVKAQIHAGGRGKGGGVKLAHSVEEVGLIASRMLGMLLKTAQTDGDGKKVSRVYIERANNIIHEYYLSVLTDRSVQKIVVIGSNEGGVDIEEVAKSRPDKIFKIFVEREKGITDELATSFLKNIGIPIGNLPQAISIIKNLYDCYLDTDASLLEINPLVLNEKRELVVLDVKFSFDDNALYRQKNILNYRDIAEEDEKELEASEYGLSYISLNGDIGCLVNGAGLAMATMDTIQLYGGNPANFLDVGGSATPQKVTAAFKIMLSNKSVKAILINIFGGIMKCDVIAEGLLQASKEVKLNVPLIVRMKGTHEEIGKKIIRESNLSIISADTMEEAAKKAIEATRERIG